MIEPTKIYPRDLASESQSKGRDRRLYDVLDKARREAAEALVAKIYSLEDSGGELIISWETEPTEADRQIFNIAWEAVGESTENVRHAIG